MISLEKKIIFCGHYKNEKENTCVRLSVTGEFETKDICNSLGIRNL